MERIKEHAHIKTCCCNKKTKNKKKNKKKKTNRPSLQLEPEQLLRSPLYLCEARDSRQRRGKINHDSRITRGAYSLVCEPIANVISLPLYLRLFAGGEDNSALSLCALRMSIESTQKKWSVYLHRPGLQ